MIIKKQNIILFYFLCALGFSVLIFKAWIAEDAFITARVIDNFINGFGLRWNVDERVQVYTHPLWLFLNIPVYALTQEFFYSTILVSLLLSISAAYFLIRKFPEKTTQILFLLIISKSFTDYTTSGLESPLTFLLSSIFLINLKDRKSFSSLLLIFSLIALNRLDLILIFLPVMLFSLAKNQGAIRFRKIFISLSPLIIWFSFSLFYYGFLFPNTKYAKLDTGIPITDYVAAGISYLLNFIKRDLPSFIIIIYAIFSSFLKKKESPESFYISLGIIFYSIYILLIGGDFMSGRLFAPLVFISVFIIAETSEQNNLKQKSFVLLLSFIVSSYFVFYPHNVFSKPFLAENFLEEKTKIHDERAWSWQTNHLLNPDILNRGKKVEDHEFAKKGLELKERAKSCEKPACYVTEDFAVGMVGYYAGANVIIIDNFAIGDALLARMEVQKDFPWWAGHFLRIPPAGYRHARETGILLEMDPNTALYYSKLRQITSGDLSDLHRLKTIIEFNIGKYKIE